MRMIRDHGSPRKYEHEVVGSQQPPRHPSGRCPLGQAARLAGWNAARRDAAARYDALLSDVAEVIRPRTLDGNDHVWHLYVIRVPDRDRVLKELQAAEIGAGIHYPVPIHLTPAFADCDTLMARSPLPSEAAHEILSLPLFATDHRDAAGARGLRFSCPRCRMSIGCPPPRAASRVQRLPRGAMLPPSAAAAAGQDRRCHAAEHLLAPAHCHSRRLGVRAARRGWQPSHPFRPASLYLLPGYMAPPSLAAGPGHVSQSAWRLSCLPVPWSPRIRLPTGTPCPFWRRTRPIVA